jgi:hypothetical protein
LTDEFRHDGPAVVDIVAVSREVAILPAITVG